MTRAALVLITFLLGGAHAGAESHAERNTLATLLASGGELLNTGSLEGYPVFVVDAGDGRIMICRVDFSDFSDFADFRKPDPTTTVATICAELE